MWIKKKRMPYEGDAIRRQHEGEKEKGSAANRQFLHQPAGQKGDGHRAGYEIIKRRRKGDPSEGELDHEEGPEGEREERCPRRRIAIVSGEKGRGKKPPSLKKDCVGATDAGQKKREL